MNFSIVIPSKSAQNITSCLEAIFKNEPSVNPNNIIVIDDGVGEARKKFPDITWIDGISPFIFSRNINLGIRASIPNDVFLVNDDAILTTPNGFSSLQKTATKYPGIVSTAVNGNAFNIEQHPNGSYSLVLSNKPISFVCVYLSRFIIQKVGLLDEQFIGYGAEDIDYCIRVQKAGFNLYIYHGCVVDHNHPEKSSFRSTSYLKKDKMNKAIFKKKWGFHVRH